MHNVQFAVDRQVEAAPFQRPAKRNKSHLDHRRRLCDNNCTSFPGPNGVPSLNWDLNIEAYSSKFKFEQIIEV